MMLFAMFGVNLPGTSSIVKSWGRRLSEMDYSEALKRIYRYLDDLDEMSKDMQNNVFVGTKKVKNIAVGIRAYVDVIAESVDYEPED